MMTTKSITESPDNFPEMNLPKEQSLILECSAAKMNQAQIDKVKIILEADLNWDSIINISYRNGVLPLVSTNLRQNFSRLLPPEIKEKLAFQFQEHWQHNLFLTAKLLEITKIFSNAEIPVLPFKGPLLASQIYGNLSLRQFVDLDILVQPKHFDEAVKKLVEHGYRAVSQIPWTKRKALFFNGEKDIGLISEDLKVKVELHWKLSGSHFALPLELDQLWKRLEETNLGGVRLKTLAFPDLFVYLCLHGSRHGWERLAWICDLRELIESKQKADWKQEIDWQQIRDHAQAHGCEKVVALGVFLIHEFFGVKTCYPGCSQIERDETLRQIAQIIKNKIFAENQPAVKIGDWYLYHLLLKEKKTDKLKLHLHYFLWYLRLVLTPNSLDKAVFKLPGIFYPLYYLLRPARLFCAYLTTQTTKKKRPLKFS